MQDAPWLKPPLSTAMDRYVSIVAEKKGIILFFLWGEIRKPTIFKTSKLLMLSNLLFDISNNNQIVFYHNFSQKKQDWGGTI